MAKNQSQTYVITLAENSAADVGNQIERAGGKLKKISRATGFATVVSDAPDFAAKVRAIPGVQGVGRDRVVQWVPKLRVFEAGDALRSGIGGPSIGDDETFAALQWATKAIHAPEAWNAGARGAGVRVAVLDGGLNNAHVDLSGGVDVPCSASAVDGFKFNQDVPGFSHATHVSGIVAARDNSVGTIGVAPSATIIGVKVLQDGSGTFEDVIDGILYAANPSNGNTDNNGSNCKRADIINMSLGGDFDPNDPELNELRKALDKATTYAYNQGVVVIASAGNDGVNHDVDPVVTLPAESQHVIAVSATGPVGYAVGYPNGATNFSRPASYTNYGTSLVDFGAPGGDFVLPGNAPCTLPLMPTGTLTRPCWVFDLMISPGTLTGNGYFFAAGTSMAAPMVAGVAALIIEKNGRPMSPDAVEVALRRSADQLGQRQFYGNGFVNAARAVGAGRGGNQNSVATR